MAKASVEFETMAKLAADRKASDIHFVTRMDRQRPQDKDFSEDEIRDLCRQFQEFESKLSRPQVKQLKRLVPCWYREDEKLKLYETYVSCSEELRETFIRFWFEGGASDKYTYDEKLDMLTYILHLGNSKLVEQYLTLFDDPEDDANCEALFRKKRRRRRSL